MASKTSKKTAVSAERRQEALELRRQGKSYHEIAQEIGISKSQAHRLVVSALEEIADQTAEEARLVRTLELERLDQLLGGVWRGATLWGDPQCVAQALKIMERRAKLLGLDAPTKVAPTDPGGESAYQPREIPESELDKRIAELSAQVGDQEDPPGGGDP